MTSVVGNTPPQGGGVVRGRLDVDADAKVHGMMEDNAMRTATETREDDNGGVVEMQDNGYGRQVRW